LRRREKAMHELPRLYFLTGIIHQFLIKRAYQSANKKFEHHNPENKVFAIRFY
jgi:hypothetical protein